MIIPRIAGKHTILEGEHMPDWAEGYIAVMDLGDDQWLVLMWLLEGRGRIARATPAGTGEHWCYDDALDATFSFLAWPHPPQRWHRHHHLVNNEWINEYQ